MARTGFREWAAVAVAAFLCHPQTAQADFASSGYFEGDLLLKDVASQYVNHGDYDPGHTEFELLADYTFVDGKGEAWRAPAGTVVNGASIPSEVWSFVGGPWSGAYRNAAVIHDWMCVARIVDSDTTHRVFYDALRASDVPSLQALVMYQAVLRGGPQWEVNSFGPTDVRRPGLTAEELQQIIADAQAGRIAVE